MSSTFGRKIKISVFGQSHSEAIGVVIDGLPSGEQIDENELADFMARRAPSGASFSTARRESDKLEIISGLFNGRTCGAPLCAVIANKDVKSSDYDIIKDCPRPGHADLTGILRYGEWRDYRGGGHFSGRLTAPIAAAGGICKQILKRRGIDVGAHIYRIADICDAPYDAVLLSEKDFSENLPDFPVRLESAAAGMKKIIESCRFGGDSVGGIIECGAVGFPSGIGDPMFDGIENRLSAALFAIPAVKGVEFGEGFGVADLRGSQNNDSYRMSDGKIVSPTNHAGGIAGGISTGMPILFRIAVKPTPSIAAMQDSVSLSERENRSLSVAGRHDPCILPRAVPVAEAVCAIVLADFLL
jgi:chorismate synthase